LKRAILGLCAPQSRLEFLSFYKCEKPSPKQIEAMKRRVISAMQRI
jgi:hypothetical protein